MDALEKGDLKVADTIADKGNQRRRYHIDPERSLGREFLDRIGNPHFFGFAGCRRVRVAAGRFLNGKQENQSESYSGYAQRQKCLAPRKQFRNRAAKGVRQHPAQGNAHRVNRDRPGTAAWGKIIGDYGIGSRSETGFTDSHADPKDQKREKTSGNPAQCGHQ